MLLLLSFNVSAIFLSNLNERVNDIKVCGFVFVVVFLEFQTHKINNYCLDIYSLKTKKWCSTTKNVQNAFFFAFFLGKLLRESKIVVPLHRFWKNNSFRGVAQSG